MKIESIELKNCNNFDEATILIQADKLNIKYGANGTGKSTIAKALLLNAHDVPNLSELTPFKYQSASETTSSDLKPQISGAENFKKIKVFNEDYVAQFLFKEDEVIRRSFEIFVQSDVYNKNMAAINTQLLSIDNTFKNEPKIDAVIKDLTDLSSAFGTTQKISTAAKFSKANASQKKLNNLPVELQGYSSFLKSSNPNKWLAWQMQGNDFIDGDEKNDCPYCVSQIADKKETILKIKDKYKAKDFEHMVAIQTIMQRLGNYFSEETKKSIDKFAQQSTEQSTEETDFWESIRVQINKLLSKLNDVRNTSFFKLKDNPNAINVEIEKLKINLNEMSCLHLQSDDTNAIIDLVNKALTDVLQKANILLGQINNQNTQVAKTIKRYVNEINEFLTYAGYQYIVDIKEVKNSYKMLFKHTDSDNHIAEAPKHLSYGERNAFSIVLFMYECLHEKPDLIILDDPISSFDKTKKFAIMHKLFRGSATDDNVKNSFYGKTVLMFTHDIEPIIDNRFVKGMSNGVPQYNTFLSFKNGTISEVEIKTSDLTTFAKICDDNLNDKNLPDVIRAIYLRRHYEVLYNKGLEYQLLASLLHKRDKPTDQIAENESKELTDGEIAKSQENIKSKFSNFDYKTLLSLINDENLMKSLYQTTNCRYEKLQLFRIINTAKNDGNSVLSENKVVAKFINETFHIENELIIQLNPRKYDPIPEYIIQECDKELGLHTPSREHALTILKSAPNVPPLPEDII